MNIDLQGLPFDSEGRPFSLPETDEKDRTFKRLPPTNKTKPPILVRYQNWQTLLHDTIEIPEAPVRAAINNDRALVVYYENDFGVFATRFDEDWEIKQAILGKRFMPHFKSAPAHVVAKNPEGFYMLIVRLSLDDFLKLDDFPDPKTKLTIQSKTQNQ